MRGIGFLKLHISASFQCFLWQACNSSLPSYDVLIHRGVNVSPTCSFCEVEEKSIPAIAFFFHQTIEIWARCGCTNIQGFINNIVFVDKPKTHLTVVTYFDVLVHLIIGNLWTPRNKFIF